MLSFGQMEMEEKQSVSGIMTLTLQEILPTTVINMDLVKVIQ